MFMFINKKRMLAMFAATMVACTAIGVLPANARIDEVISDGYYSTPLAKEVEVIKTATTKIAPVAKTNTGNQIQMEYQVRPGDTLWSIADRSGISVDELAQANHLEEKDVLVIGRTLIIPGVESRYHRVAAGETLGHIAGQYGISVQQIMLANHISNADLISLGRMLTIPGEVNQETVPTVNTAQGGKIQIGGWTWPAAGDITSYFGIREDSPHEGIDIGAWTGSTIVAPEKARVVWAAPRGTYGLAVILDHGNGIRSLYAHCSKLLVQEGQTVEKNQSIALVGNTGRSSGPHLHMEVLRQGIPLDPLLFLKERL